MEFVGRGGDADAPGDLRCAFDQARRFESKHHLMDRRRSHPEVPLDICLRRWLPVHLRVEVDEREVATLLLGVRRLRLQRHDRPGVSDVIYGSLQQQEETLCTFDTS